MTFTAENIFFLGAVLIFASIVISKWGYRFGVPTLLLFLFTGMLFGSDGLGLEFNSHEDAQLIGMLSLSVILFSGGMDTKRRDIEPVASQGLMLSTVGVLITTVVTGLLIYYLSEWTRLDIGLTLPMSMLLAANEYINGLGAAVGLNLNIPHIEVPTPVSLAVIFGVLALSMLLPFFATGFWTKQAEK